MTTKAPPALRPVLRLADIFPGTCVFNPREPYGGNPFVPADVAVSDALTGGQLSLTGDLPVLCHRSVATERVLALIGRAGFGCASRRDHYDDENGYRALLAGRSPGTVVFQHAHPASVVDPALSRIPLDTLTWLNNKSNLTALVPASATPRRQLLPIAGAAAQRRWASLSLPVVIKVPSEHSLNSGEGVRICRDGAALRNALADFSDASVVIVEEFVEIRANWCVQYACLAAGRVRYLGTAEQIVDQEGRYQGNWIPTAEPPGTVIDLGREIATRGAARGYLGIAGFDVVATADGRILVLDLNFRVNGSTAGLLYRDALLDRYGPVEIKCRTLRDPRGWAHARDLLTEHVDAGRILPYAGYDPAPGSSVGARLSVLATGRTRDDVARLLAGLARLGLV